MRTGSLLATLLASTVAAQVHAQIQPPADARLVGFLTEPRVPEFGQVYDLVLTVRVAPDVVVFMPDTLIPSEATFSAGPGGWTVTAAPADSLDIRARYPVMSFLAGGVFVPSIEVLTRPPGPGEEPGVRPASEAGAGADPLRIPTGAIQIVTHSGLALAEEDGRVPRPPADVLGGQWSAWFVAGTALLGSAAALLLWLLVGRWRSAYGTREDATATPKEAALRELERIRNRGWHTDGRVVDFYDASTNVLRRFSEHEGPDWGTALTSTELVRRLEDRWGAEALGELSEAVGVAERVKFGSHRPDAATAEVDWETIRAWIERMPED